MNITNKILAWFSKPGKTNAKHEPEKPVFMTVKEVAEMLRYSPGTIRMMATRGKIPCVKLYGRLLFNLKNVLAWIESQNKMNEQRKAAARERNREWGRNHKDIIKRNNRRHYERNRDAVILKSKIAYHAKKLSEFKIESTK